MELMIAIKNLGLPKGTSKIDIENAYRNASENIKKSIDGYDEFYYSVGTNRMIIEAKWKGKELSANLKKIKENQYVANYLIYHDPIRELEEAVNNHDIFKAYSLGCTLFESYGAKILREHFDSNNLHVGNDIMNRINLQIIIVMLYTNKKIAKSDYDDMRKINSIRNELVIHLDVTKKLDENNLVLSTDYLDKILTYVNKLKN